MIFAKNLTDSMIRTLCQSSSRQHQIDRHSTTPPNHSISVWVVVVHSKGTDDWFRDAAHDGNTNTPARPKRSKMDLLRRCVPCCVPTVSRRCSLRPALPHNTDTAMITEHSGMSVELIRVSEIYSVVNRVVLPSTMLCLCCVRRVARDDVESCVVLW